MAVFSIKPRVNHERGNPMIRSYLKLAAEPNTAYEEMFGEELDQTILDLIKDGDIPDEDEAERMVDQEELSMGEYHALLAGFQEVTA
jgi:hypothetical protein